MLWLMAVAVMPAVRASLYLYQPQHYRRPMSVLQQLLQGPAIWTAVLSFVAMVVVPYVIARAWERAALTAPVPRVYG